MKLAAALLLGFLLGIVTVFALASLMGGAPKAWRDGGWRDAEPVTSA